MARFDLIDDRDAQLLAGGGKASVEDSMEAKGAPLFEGAALPPGLTKKAELMGLMEMDPPKGWSIGKKEGWLKPLGEKKPKPGTMEDDTEALM